MMGAGKSTIGQMLASQTGREFVDTDKLIENRLGRSIAQFFRLYGEEAFRDHETAVIKSLQAEPLVVATGGGAIVREENFAHLRKIGKVIYLKSEPTELINRLQHSKKKRPLLNSEDWQSKVVDILSVRSHLYDQADFVVEVDGSEQDAVVQRIMELLEVQN